MAAPDFPASPTVGQIYTAPSGNVYTYDGAVWNTTGSAQSAYWSDTGTTLTPTTTTRMIDVPGATTGTDAYSLRFGTSATKGRLHATDAENYVRLSSNARLQPGIAWTQDNTAKPSWLINLFGETATDRLEIDHFAPGGAMTTLFTLDNAGT